MQAGGERTPTSKREVDGVDVEGGTMWRSGCWVSTNGASDGSIKQPRAIRLTTGCVREAVGIEREPSKSNVNTMDCDCLGSQRLMNGNKKTGERKVAYHSDDVERKIRMIAAQGRSGEYKRSQRRCSLMERCRQQ